MTRPPETLPELRERHHAEERDLLRAWLEAVAWTIYGVAQAWGVGVSTVQAALRRHPDVEEERVERIAGRGPGPVRD